MAAGRTQVLAENSDRNWCAVVGQIPRSWVVLASVHEHTEFILDSFWNVKPMELGMHESRQTAVKFSGVTDNAHSRFNNHCRLSVMTFGALAKTALQ